MSERDAFTRRICETPADDTVRLVFADWLSEHEEPERAEFIRVQCGLYGPPLWTRQQLALRQQQLFAANAAWSGWPGCPGVRVDVVNPEGLRSIHPTAVGCLFTRGFVSEIHLPTAAFLEHAGAIFAAHPVTRVRLTDIGHCIFVTDSPPKCASDRLRSSVLLYPFLKSDEWATHGFGGQPDWRRWKSRVCAERAWSDACVAYGRELADLPHLP